MSFLGAFVARLRGLRATNDTDARLADEIRFHIDMQTEKNLRSGMAPDAARRSAMTHFGGVERYKDETRDQYRTRPLEDAIHDLRYAVRTLRRAPAFGLTTILTLAIGIGANTAIFSAVDGVLLKPLPYVDADRLMTIWQHDMKKDSRDPASPANFLDWRDRARSFAVLAAAEPFSLTLTTPDGPEMIRNWNVTEGFFAALGVHPFLGRFFEPGDFVPNAPPVVVISYESWQRRFGGRPSVVGTRLQLGGATATIVGVIPRNAAYPAGREVWSPKILTEDDRQLRGSGFYPVIGRLRAGVSRETAEAEMRVIAQQLAKENPRTNANIGSDVVPMAEYLVGGVRKTLWLLVGAVGLLLLVACANVANLLVARTMRRARELAIRTALGAGRGRVVRLLMAESALLAIVGAAGGMVLARWGVAAIRALAPVDLPRVEEIHVDFRALGFALAVALVTSAIFGLAPSLRAARGDAQQELKSGGRGSTGGRAQHRARNAIVGAEVALAVVLLTGAGLLIRSFITLLRVDRGYQVDHIVSATMFTWQWNDGPARLAGFADQLVDRVRALPGVRAAAVSTSVPLAEAIGPQEGRFTIEGQTPSADAESRTTRVVVATPELLDVLRIPLRGGRRFTRDDDARRTQVVLINETMARRYWPNENPVGKRIQLRYAGPPTSREIIGIVGDVRDRSLETPPSPGILIPLAQAPTGSIMVVARTANDPASAIPAIRAAVASLNPNLPIARTATLEGLTDDALRFRRFILLLLGSFAATALALATVGVYGLIAQSAAERRQEIGVRIALGARTPSVLRYMLRQGLGPASAGVAVGLLASAWLTRLLRGMLYEVAPLDAATFLLVPALMVMLAAAASLIPAWRAARVDPLTALRAG